jgi:hypothetical protein
MDDLRSVLRGNTAVAIAAVPAAVTKGTAHEKSEWCQDLGKKEEGKNGSVWPTMHRDCANAKICTMREGAKDRPNKVQTRADTEHSVERQGKQHMPISQPEGVRSMTVA